MVVATTCFVLIAQQCAGEDPNGSVRGLRPKPSPATAGPSSLLVLHDVRNINAQISAAKENSVRYLRILQGGDGENQIVLSDQRPGNGTTPDYSDQMSMEEEDWIFVAGLLREPASVELLFHRVRRRHRAERSELHKVSCRRYLQAFRLSY